MKCPQKLWNQFFKGKKVVKHISCKSSRNKQWQFFPQSIKKSNIAENNFWYVSNSEVFKRWTLKSLVASNFWKCYGHNNSGRKLKRRLI